MARPIREPPVLKGEDAFRSTFGRLQGKNFEMRRLEVEYMSKEQWAALFFPYSYETIKF